VVAITGDLPAFQCGAIRDLPDPTTGTPLEAFTVTPAAFEAVMAMRPQATCSSARASGLQPAARRQ